jgi:lactoylglutathione lyase
LQEARHGGGSAHRERGGPVHEHFLGCSQRQGARRHRACTLTFNWDPEKYGEGRNFGHLAFEVDDIYATCEKLMQAGITINRPPRDGRMAFIRSPDNVSIELLQKGASPQPKKEPWASMPNTGKW